MAGVDAISGQIIDGFAHVEQSLSEIIFTQLGERVMREWFGNPGLKLLGENMNEQTIVRWFAVLYAVIDLFEPRFRIVSFETNDLTLLGVAEFTIQGEYRPYAHLDWQQVQAFVSVNGNTVTIRPAQ